MKRLDQNPQFRRVKAYVIQNAENVIVGKITAYDTGKTCTVELTDSNPEVQQAKDSSQGSNRLHTAIYRSNLTFEGISLSGNYDWIAFLEAQGFKVYSVL